MKAIFFYDTDIGKIGLIEKDGKLVRLLLPGETYAGNYKQIRTPFLNYVHQQIVEYLSKQRITFNVPCNPKGTPFQKKIWQILMTIPYGKVSTYQDIARLSGNVKASRAVGMANHYNPIPIIIPCHRVVGKDGKLTGYAGGLPIKKKLLELECVKIENNRISCSR